MTSRLFLAVVLALTLTGCQRSPSAPRPAGETPADAATRAHAAIERQDWAGAAPLLREALATQPNDLSLHYGLAVAASYLDLRDEAAREFRWVLGKAESDSQEYKAARSWLAEAEGGAGGTPARTAAAAPHPADKPGVLDVQRAGDAGLWGHVTWSSAPGGPYSTKRMTVHLKGLPGTSSKEQRYMARTDDDGRYEFKKIVAGPYMISDRVAGQPVWRLKVQVEPGRDTVFDLNPGNSLSVRDDFPDDGT